MMDEVAGANNIRGSPRSLCGRRRCSVKRVCLHGALANCGEKRARRAGYIVYIDCPSATGAAGPLGVPKGK